MKVARAIQEGIFAQRRKDFWALCVPYYMEQLDRRIGEWEAIHPGFTDDEFQVAWLKIIKETW